MPSARRRITLAIVLAGVCLAGVEVWLKWRDDRTFFQPAILLSRFPAEDATVLSLDVITLRRAGLLAGSKIAAEPEYQQFLDGTGFDYRRDLDLAVASFSKSGSFFIARGRFDWPKLRAYAARHGGSCYQDLCRLQGSTPERHISFLPLRRDTIALAVSTDDLAASRLTVPGQPVTVPLPAAPVWISVAGSALRRQAATSPSIHLMLSALVNADRVVLTMEPESQGIVAHMEATCRSRDDAKALAGQLQSLTGLPKSAALRDKQVQEDDLARMLTAGTFDQNDRRVAGKWPVGKSLLESLTAGI